MAVQYYSSGLAVQQDQQQYGSTAASRLDDY
jgi:hypothetical protein